MRPKGIAAMLLLALLTSASASAQYGSSSDCQDARSTAESTASELASYAKRLQRCAESADLSDDCNSEYRHVRSAYDDYESAVSDVSSSVIRQAASNISFKADGYAAA
jgi:hypothetical protein